MALQFGQTWWGEQFLNALTDIDYSNRLPRGRSYARNGSVAEIQTSNNRIDAKVRGSRRTPYKVQIGLPLFSDAEKAMLMQAITDDPLVLSHLLNRELPDELNAIAQRHKMAVFPKKWSDFDMDCSCPDWAVPCKHLAAVIYMLSAEIDRDPFLVFRLHGLDILKELSKAGLTLNKEMRIPGFEQLLLDKPVVVEDMDTLGDAPFDLSKITPQTNHLLSLLEAKPVFYGKAFSPLLLRHYKAVGRHSKEWLSREVVEFEPKVFESMEKVELLLDGDGAFHQVILHADRGDLVLDASDDGLDSLIQFLIRLPKKYEERLSAGLRSLYRAWHFSLKLAECGAYIPQLLELNKNHYVIRWIPAVINEEVDALLTMLEHGLPQNLVQVQSAAKKCLYLSPRDQAMALVSLFLTHFMKEVSPTSSTSYPDTETKIEQLFFLNHRLRFSQLRENQLAEAMHQFLQRFYLGHKTYVPLIKIVDDATEGTFDLQLWVENRKAAMQELLTLQGFIEDKAYNSFKASLFHSMASLSRDFPAIKPLISSSGTERLSFDAEGFVEVLFHVLPVLKLLGIRILLPNSLKYLARPQASLKMDSRSSDATVRAT
ncbi:SWIM zinc finger family protein [Geofilum rubicundum]|uniref:SWF/SNF family helicase n=1 Tax=Geofilum rubicundum JCM 15548 TaxID=1236989 RepID=A0A0E9LQB4_9BACT|nr:SWIM zinc finger family protein [Geofilum rubicundum]GAO27807.1 SWF/SNF family helicase [Geofilum rubicundum JCM 15548]